MKTSLRFALFLCALSPWAYGADDSAPPAPPAMPAPPAEAPPPAPPGPPQGPEGHMHHGHGPMVDVAFMGISTDMVQPALTDQLGLPKGEGLIVVEVAAGSPAADLLKKHDVVTRIDDQILIDPHQLSVLVRNHKVGDTVTVTYVRLGKEAQAQIKLASHSVPEDAGMNGPHREVRHLRMLAGPGGAPDGSLEEMGPPPPGAPGAGGGPEIRIERRPGSVEDGDGDMETAIHAVKWDTPNGSLVLTDESGTMNLNIKDGKQTLVATDTKGATIFSGPVDTPEQKAAMPADLRARFDKLEGSIHGHLNARGELPGMGPGPDDRGQPRPAPAA